MYFEHISSTNELQDRTLNSIVLSENQTLATESTKIIPKSHEINSNFCEFFLWATFLSIISLVLVKAFQRLDTVKFRGLPILPASQIPCRNCKFFAQNQYLNCAVRPFTVLTKQAQNCSDYCSRDGSSLEKVNSHHRVNY